MKNVLLLALFLFSLNVNAQIPDSLNVNLPWEKIFVTDCSTDVESPTTSNSDIHISNADIFPINDSNNECVKIIRNWTIINWTNAATYTFIQVAYVLDDYPISCEENYKFINETFPVELTPADLVQVYDPSIEYSFSQDTIVNSIWVAENSNDFSVFVYNNSDSTYCKTNILVNYCEDNLIFNVPNSIEIEFNEEPFIPLSLQALGITIDYPCGIDTVAMRVKSSNYASSYLFPYHIGSNRTIVVDLFTTSGEQYTKEITATITGTPPPPIPMYIEDKELEAGVETTIDVWSENLDSILAWQLLLSVQNATIIAMEDSDQFEDILVNIHNDNQTVKSFWSSEPLVPVDVEFESTWLSLVVLPEIDGSTADILVDLNDPYNEIVFEANNNIISGLGASFEFNIVEKGTVSNNSEVLLNQIKLRSNLVSNEIQLMGLASIDDTKSISIFSSNGHLMDNSNSIDNIDELVIDVNDFPSGIYMVVIEANSQIKTLRFIKK